MTDPFVERMLARTRARRNAILRDSDSSNKENVQVNYENEIGTKLAHSAGTSEPKESQDPKGNQEISSLIDISSSALGKVPLPPVLSGKTECFQAKPVISASVGSPDKSSVGQSRLSALQRRCRTISEWEDDYSYHTNLHSRMDEVNKSDVSDSHHKNLMKNGDSADSTSSESKQKSTYYFGENTSQAQKSIGDGIQESKLSYLDSLSQSAFNKMPPCPAPLQTPENKSPTKTLQWDKQLLSTLDAGEQPLRKDLPHTPSKIEGLGTNPVHTSPKIVSCVPKNQSANLGGKSSPGPSFGGQKQRDTSPTKVADLRDRWEQNIRQASPERVPRSLSPAKPAFGSRVWSSERSSRSHNTRKDSSSDSDQHLPRCFSRSRSPVKASSPHKGTSPAEVRDQCTQKPVVSQVQSLKCHSSSELSPAKKSFSSTMTNSPRSLASLLCEEKTKMLGPRNNSFGAEQALSAAAVASPALPDVYSKSVKERAAVFDMGNTGSKQQKDPSELSIQDRCGIFEKESSVGMKPAVGQSKSKKHKPAVSRGSGQAYSAALQPNYSERTRIQTSDNALCTTGVELGAGDRDANSGVSTHCHMFENIKDNWMDNEINAKIQEEKKKDMGIIMNRYKRTAASVAALKKQVDEREYESEEEYPDSVSSEDSGLLELGNRAFHDARGMSHQPQREGLFGPPKPPRLGHKSSSDSSPEHSHLDYSPERPSSKHHARISSANSHSPLKSNATPEVRLGQPGMPPPPPPLPHPAASLPCVSSKMSSNASFSPSKIFNSTEVDVAESTTSPRKPYTPKIKPGCLFPSLSDIESHSEAVDSQESDVEDVAESSFAESIMTCASGESLGQHIRQMAQETNAGFLSTITEQTEPVTMDSVSESTFDALEAIDNAIDEAFDDECTPPKRSCTGDELKGDDYKTPKLNPESSEAWSLAHSISMYRQQKSAEVNYTPVRKIAHQSRMKSPSPEPVSPSVKISASIAELQEEEAAQLNVISQASGAITVVSEHPEQSGTVQHIEAEKLLLLATQKRQAALNEIQRLKAEGAMAQKSWAEDCEASRGSVSISNIALPLKRSFIKKELAGDAACHFVVLVRHRAQLICSQLQSAPGCIVDDSITFPNLMSLHGLSSDFNITLEVYAFKTQVHHSSKHSSKKDHGKLKLTPRRKIHKSSSHMSSPCVSSPGGPHAIRSSAFQLVGFTHLCITSLHRNAWTLEKVPFNSPLDGHLLMRINCSMEAGMTEHSFLTTYDDVGGFGAWNRRWFVLDGIHLNYWRYPEDEGQKEKSGCLDLRTCTTRKVDIVSRDICARQHTFSLTFLRPARQGDASNLVQEVRGTSVISRLLLSADSKEERVVWCNKLNKALANIRAWEPNALHPEDFQV